MKYNCDVIKDLIPLYIDGCTSDESDRIVKGHLKACHACQTYYSAMTDGSFNDEDGEKKEVLDYGKRIRRRRVKIALIILLAMVLQAAVIIGGMASMTALGSVYDTNDPYEYGQFDKHFEGEAKGRLSHLLTFPESVDTSSVNNYRYYASEKGLDNQYLIYLDQTLTEEAYLSEVERLRTIETRYKEKSNAVLFKQVEGYKACIAVYNHNDCYEYVLLDDSHHRLIYLYSQFKGPDAYLIDHNLWLAVDLDLGESNALDKAGYSIYYFMTGKNQLYMINDQQLDKGCFI